MFKPSDFVKCQLVFNFARKQVQAHYDIAVLILSISFKCVKKA